MDLCDQVQNHRSGPKDGLKAILKRLNNPDPHVVLQAITVSIFYQLDVKNTNYESSDMYLLYS